MQFEHIVAPKMQQWIESEVLIEIPEDEVHVLVPLIGVN